MADTYNLQIQRARNGSVIESDYVTVATVSGFTPGAAWTYIDSSPTNYNELIAERARWVCVADSTVFSDWSEVRWVRSTAPVQGNTMALTFPPVTRQQTKVGIGVERVPGQAVQAAYGLDTPVRRPSLVLGRATSQANRNSPSIVSDETVAYSTTAFGCDADMRQAGAIPRCLQAGYQLDLSYNTVGYTTVAAANGVPQYYIAKLVPTLTGELPITVTDQVGTNVQVFSGCRLDTLNFTSDKEATEPFRASMEFRALCYAMYPGNTNTDLSLTGINAVSYENSKYGPTDWAASFGGVQSPDCRTVTFNANRNLQEIAVGNYLTGASAHVSDGTSVTLTVGLYWRSLAELKQYLGVTDQTLTMFGQTKLIVRKEFRWTFRPPMLPNGFQHVFELVCPDCSMGSNPLPAQESGPFMQELTFIPRQDLASANFVDHYFLYTTTENPALWATPQPEIPVYPAQSMYPHNCVPGIATAGGNATTFASTANAYLALAVTDNTYNGLTLQFTTGTLAGQRQVITGYVASSRTFTVGTAFTAAPSAGDNFIVIGGYGKT